MLSPHRLRSWLLDRLVPAFELGAHGGSAFLIYSFQKSVLVENRVACPLMDPIVRMKSDGAYTYVAIGSLDVEEVIPSFHLPRKVNPLELALSLLFLQRVDIANYRFLNVLYDSPMLCLLKSGGRWHEWRWFRRCLALRNFLLAHYFSLKFRTLALRCERAYVLVYYNAIMLGVVSAFRKLGKEAWDVQHGYLGPDHAAYGNATAFAIPSTFRPSGFLVWDSRFGRYIESMLKMRWESTGNHHLQSDKPAEARRKDGFTVLYSLQWGTPIPEGVQVAAERHAGVRWVFRRHPFDDPQRNDLNELKAMPNCSISDSSESLGDALRKCDLHVTFNSGVVHEAAALGIPSVFLDKELAARVGEEMSLGLAMYAPGPSLADEVAARLEVTESRISDQAGR